MKRTAIGLMVGGVVVLAAGADERLRADAEGGAGDGVVRNAPEARRAVLWDLPRRLTPPGAAGEAPAASFINVNGQPDGDLPMDVAFTADGTAAVIANATSDNLGFFEVASGSTTAAVGVGDFPVHVAVTPDNRYALTPNVFSNDVSVVDIATRTLVANVPITGDQPYRVAVAADSSIAVVGVINDAVASSFSVIDLDTLTEVDSFASASQGVIGFFATPETGRSGALFTQFALTPDGSQVVLPDRAGSVRVYAVATGSEQANLATAGLATAVDISADGTTAVVSHESSNRTVSVIDLATPSVTSAWATASNLTDQVIRITPDKSHALAAISNNVIFVNLATGATTATISTGVVGDIELSFDGQYAFVSNFNARVIDIASQSLVATMTFAACAPAATSPTELRAVALNNRFREDIHMYGIAGAAGAFQAFDGAGPGPEGDGCTGVDVTPDGALAVVCNVVSRNVAIIDLATDTVRSYVEVGDRPKEVRITPDGAYALVCAMDANALQIIDLSTDTIVRTLSIFSRPARVRIAPDGQFAYVLNVAGSDQITFIQLDGAASSIVAQVPAGQTGVANGYSFTETSGIELSPDGSLLAVCDSFNDLLRIYDTALQTQIAAVGVGDFPIRAQFAPDGGRVYVSNAFGDSVSVVDNVGGVWQAVGTVPGIDFPLTLDVGPGGTHAYVGNSGSSPAIRVIDAATLNVVRTLPFVDSSPRDSFLDPNDGVLYAAATDGRLVRVAAAGAASTVIDATPLTGGPADLAFHAPSRTALMALPAVDGVDAVRIAVPGDVDGDCDVDFDDLLVVLGAFGAGAAGDADGDGDTDLDDLLIVLGSFGQTCG